MRWVSSVTVGVLLLGLSVEGGRWIANPGVLTNQHTEIGGCIACHSNFKQGIRGWLHAALGVAEAPKDSERCITCHQLGNSAMQAHSISANASRRLTISAQPPTEKDGPLFVKAGTAMFGRTHLSGELTCMSCHREHQGADFSLKRMSNQSCTSCHAAQFNSFSSGHPELSDYPYKRRTRIKFDHVGHINKHFQEDDFKQLAPMGCNDCHQPDSTGGTMQVQNFDQMCSGCHLDQIVGDSRASAKGILVFGVPGLDIETLYDRGISLGEWPELAEEPVSPFTEMLLSTDPVFADNYQTVREYDFLDLTDLDDATLKRVAIVAWSFKELMLDLTTRGAEALRDRLETVIGRPLDDNETADLLAMLPTDMILNAQQNWFQSLTREVALHRRGEYVEAPAARQELEQLISESGEDQSLMIVGAEENQTTDGDNELTSNGDDELLAGGDDDLLTDGDDGLLTGGDDGLLTGGDDDLLTGGDDDLLTDGDDDLLTDGDDGLLTDGDDGLLTDGDDGLLTDGDDDLLTDGDEDDLLGSTSDGLADYDLIGGSLLDDQFEVAEDGLEEPADEKTEREALSAEDWMAFGGWYRDEFVLRYRPNGHSDRFMHRWINLASEIDQNQSLRIFDMFTSEQAPGVCAKCHSVDRTIGDDNALVVNWTGQRIDPLVHPFTLFSHISHFSLLGEKGCFTCHQLDNNSDLMSSFEDQDPATFSSNFEPMKRSICSECHQANKAGDSCLSCHNYHIGTFQPTDLVRSQLATDPQ